MRFGWIRLQGLHIDGVRVGIYPHEKRADQSLIIDAALYCELGKAAKSEQIAHTIDYDRVAELIRTTARERYYPLVETLVDRLLARILESFPAKRVTVEIQKPGALAPGSVSVAMERRR